MVKELLLSALYELCAIILNVKWVLVNICLKAMGQA